MIYSWAKHNLFWRYFFVWWDSDSIWSRLMVELTSKWLFFVKSVPYGNGSAKETATKGMKDPYGQFIYTAELSS